MVHPFFPPLARAHLSMAFRALVRVAGTACYPPWYMDSYEISFAWQERIGIIMAIVAGYVPIDIDGFCRTCSVAFLACNVLINGVHLMRYLMADKAVSTTVYVGRYCQCLGDGWFSRHMAALADTFGYQYGEVAALLHIFSLGAAICCFRLNRYAPFLVYTTFLDYE